MVTVTTGRGDGPLMRESDLPATAQSRGELSSSDTVSVTGATTAPPVLAASMRARASFEVKPLTGTLRRATKCRTWPGARTNGPESGVLLSGWPSPLASGSSTAFMLHPPARSVTVIEKVSIAEPGFVSVCGRLTVVPGSAKTWLLCWRAPPTVVPAGEPPPGITGVGLTAGLFPACGPGSQGWVVVAVPAD